mmetsp:Transcript_6796/g.15588  ORF Transcript_6796/g.15588 Transcript_6796/m.15588 type:complete len:191 (+) Transcript_6796:433-1005(+)
MGSQIVFAQDCGRGQGKAEPAAPGDLAFILPLFFFAINLRSVKTKSFCARDMEMLARTPATQAAAEEAAEKEAKLRAASEGYTERKARRKIIAGKSTHIANFLQRAALQTQDQRAKAELLELYQKANRVNLELWNEFETPTVPGTKDDSWAEAVAAYRRGSEITGMVIMLEGRQLETRNPWDPPPAQGEL